MFINEGRPGQGRENKIENFKLNETIHTFFYG